MKEWLEPHLVNEKTDNLGGCEPLKVAYGGAEGYPRWPDLTAP